MDWALAIRLNRDALRAVVASIAALIGGRDGSLLPRGIRNAALALLRPAEAAARRLIVIAARGLAVPQRRPAPVFAHQGSAAAPSAAGEARAPAFRLVDPQMRVPPPLLKPEPRGVPRIRTFWSPAAMPLVPAFQPPPQAAPPPIFLDPAEEVDARRLRLRLASLERALADLPRQARRLLRWRARRDAEAARSPGAGIMAGRTRSPLRLGPPPGHRIRDGRGIGLILRECHALARDALDSS